VLSLIDSIESMPKKNLLETGALILSIRRDIIIPVVAAAGLITRKDLKCPP